MDAWRAGFQSTNTGATVNYDPSGSGAGVEQFNAGGVDFAGSDSALDDDEGRGRRGQEALRRPDAIEVPDYVSPIAVVFNLEGVDELQLSPKTIAGIFDGKITTWNDAAIKADNPDAKLPSHQDRPRCTARTSRAPPRTSPTTSSKAGDGAWTHAGRQGVADQVRRGRQGHLGRDRRGQERQGHHRVRRRSARPATSSAARSRSATQYVEPSAEGAAKAVEVSPARGGPRRRTTWPSKIDRTTTPSRRLPADAGLLPDRLPDLRRRQGRPGQGLPHLRRQRPRARRPRPRTPARRRSRRRFADEGRRRSSTRSPLEVSPEHITP